MVSTKSERTKRRPDGFGRSAKIDLGKNAPRSTTPRALRLCPARAPQPSDAYETPGRATSSSGWEPA
jgi:hypothetical protein